MLGGWRDAPKMNKYFLFLQEVSYLQWVGQQHDLGDGGWGQDGVEGGQLCLRRGQELHLHSLRV